MSIMITGGAGFIGSNYILEWFKTCHEPLINLDCLSYAGNLENLSSLIGSDTYRFVQGDINNFTLLQKLLKEHRPRAIIHLAAESHVDRSISGPAKFVETNILGTFTLLEAARAYWSEMAPTDQSEFRFLHVSTDEVYGSLKPNDPEFTEHHPYSPNSPYSASKASSDHLVRAYHHTYGLPTLITNCSNNYGPFQFPEKFIPLLISNALSHMSLPIYGDGRQIRDWLYVGDHCSAIRRVLDGGVPGETYNIGGLTEKANIEIAERLCEVLDGTTPRSDGKYYNDLITHVKDRPGHDRRYAVNADKIRKKLNWEPSESFDTGLIKTVNWYLTNPGWLERVVSGEYRNWLERQYS